MWYIVMFAGLAILLVVVVLVRNARTQASGSRLEEPSGTANASRTAHGSNARKERKRRRTQSRNARRKRH